jgi:DNA-directed RNA polymerase subunit RPC12/RpoP
MTEAKPELVECRACGHQISVKAKFCPNCGDRITLKEKVLKPYQKTTNFLKRWNHHYQIEKEKKKGKKEPILKLIIKDILNVMIWMFVVMAIIGVIIMVKT